MGRKIKLTSAFDMAEWECCPLLVRADVTESWDVLPPPLSLP